MRRLTTFPPEELQQLTLELSWSLQPRGATQKLFLQLYSLMGEEPELLLDMEHWFPPATVVTDSHWSSTVIWHSGYRQGRHHLAFPGQIVEERLEGKLDPLRLALGVSALEGTFDELSSYVSAPERVGLLTGEVDSELDSWVRAQSCTVIW